MGTLARAAIAYPSELTRGQIEDAAASVAASAPQEGAHESRFAPELRPALHARAFDREDINWRFATPPGPIAVDDAVAGRRTHDPASTIGDFVVWTKRAQPAYQLAVVVDDHRQGVTHVVRGSDLLDSAARQLLLYRALRLSPEPRYAHLPLVRGQDGKRLAKRHGDTRIDSYRAQGVPVERVVGLIAFWSGAAPSRTPLSPREFAGAFSLDTMARQDVTFTPEDDAWLRAK